MPYSGSCVRVWLWEAFYALVTHVVTFLFTSSRASQPSSKPKYSGSSGCSFSSALFAVLHLAGGVGWVAVPLFVVGLILGWGYARTGNLLTNITAHALNNAIGVILLYTST